MVLKKVKGCIRKTLRIFSKLKDKIDLVLLKFNYPKNMDTSEYIQTVPTNKKFFQQFSYMDESNEIISKMFGIPGGEDTDARKYRVDRTKGAILVDTQQQDGENWLVFSIDQLPKEYVLEFDYVQQSDFCEFQIAFNYKSLYERNRFLVMENDLVLFDCIKNGHFYPPVYRETSPGIFHNKVNNHVKLVCRKKNYALFINEQLVLSVDVKKQLCHGNGAAIVLWENYNNRRVQVQISDIEIHEIL